jgi:hypothetical protein
LSVDGQGEGGRLNGICQLVGHVSSGLDDRPGGVGLRLPVVAVRGGEARVIVRGETIDDLLSRDAGIATPTKGNE